MLQWLRANGCPWNQWTCLWAAGGGHLEVLQWARANGCSWDEGTCEFVAKCGGNEDIVEWVRMCKINETFRQHVVISE